jgi:spore coat protein U-like protein
MRNVLIKTVAASLLTAAGATVSAKAGVTDPATTTFTVSATVLPACTVSATNLAFGNYTPTAGAVPGTSTVTVNCTVGTTGTVSLNQGLTGTIAQRQMSGPTGTTTKLFYNLYTTNTYATIWGNTAGATQAVTGAGLAAANATTLTVYGNLPDNANNQAAAVGAYTDTVTVSVAY